MTKSTVTTVQTADLMVQISDLIAEVASLRDKLSAARNLTDKMLDGVLDHYTSMSDVRIDVYTLQDILKD